MKTLYSLVSFEYCIFRILLNSEFWMLSIFWKPVGHWRSSHCLFFSNSNCKHLEMVLLSPHTWMDCSRCDWADGFCKSYFSCQFLKFIIISVLKIVLMIYFLKLRRINLAIFFFRTAQWNTLDERQNYQGVSNPSFCKKKGPMCFLDITAQSPESTGHVSLYQSKKRLSSPSALLFEGTALSLSLLFPNHPHSTQEQPRPHSNEVHKN